MLSLEHLHRFFIDAYDDGTFGRAKIQIADSLCLGKKRRVWALEPLANPMWSQVLEAQDTADLTHAEPVTGLLFERVCQRTVRPDVPERSGGFLPIWSLTRKLNELAADCYWNSTWSPTALSVFERLYAWRRGETRLPLAHRPPCASQLSSDLLGADTLMGQQQHSRSLHYRIRRSMTAH